MRTLRIAAAFLLLTALNVGCGERSNPAAPSDPGLDLPSPMTAVRAPTEALPFWARGPLCCFDDYAVIYFYVADPSVIPTDFNLLDFFDFRALGAELAVEGFNIRKNAGDPEPQKTILHGAGPVAFWFIPETIYLEEIVNDGIVTMAELARDEVIQGFASTFTEELHPSVGATHQVQILTSAQGDLTDGGRFRVTNQLHVNGKTGEVTAQLNGSLVFN